MITIISCTNRPNSKSIEVAGIYKEILDHAGEENQIIDLIELPREFIFSALYDNTGKDAAFNPFVEKIRNSTKYVFIVPEYNGSFPGILKGFIDGLDFPSPLEGKPAALVGISSGPMGGALALSHFTDILHYLGMHILPEKVRLARINSLISDQGLNDQFLQELLETQAQKLISF